MRASLDLTDSSVRLLRLFVVTGACCAAAAGCIHLGASSSHERLNADARAAAIAHAGVWTRTDIPSMDLKAGPQGPGSFLPGQTVVCDFVDETMKGHSPKFTCALDGDDKIKVKYGRDNGEVYGEVAATRLLWALGFGADREYPVRVVCRCCPAERKGGDASSSREIAFDVAAIERKAPGHEIVGPEGPGWAWFEFNESIRAKAGRRAPSAMP
jgi:hypothetical protein